MSIIHFHLNSSIVRLTEEIKSFFVFNYENLYSDNSVTIAFSWCDVSSHKREWLSRWRMVSVKSKYGKIDFVENYFAESVVYFSLLFLNFILHLFWQKFLKKNSWLGQNFDLEGPETKIDFWNNCVLTLTKFVFSIATWLVMPYSNKFWVRFLITVFF